MTNYINQKKLKYYKLLSRRGDAEKIAKLAGVTRGTIYIALSEGRCSVSLAEAIDIYFKKRFEEIKKLVNATENS